jgi:hypothetical protein
MSILYHDDEYSGDSLYLYDPEEDTFNGSTDSGQVSRSPNLSTVNYGQLEDFVCTGPCEICGNLGDTGVSPDELGKGRNSP